MNELAIKILTEWIWCNCDDTSIQQAIELLKNPKEFDEIDMMNAIEYGHDLAMQETTRTPEQWIEDYRKQKLTTESK